MGKVLDKVERNLRDRVDALWNIPRNARAMVDDLINYTRERRPIKGVTSALKKVGEGTLDAIQAQFDITRRWFERG